MQKHTPQSIPTRDECSPQDTWDLTPMFSSVDVWHEELNDLHANLPQVQSFKGRLGESADVFFEALAIIYALEERLEAVVVYAQLRFSENLQDSQRFEQQEKAIHLYTEWNHSCSFLSPEVLQLDQSIIDTYLSDSRIQDYKFAIEKIIRRKQHILSEAEETLLALQKPFASASQKAFSILTDVDMQFGSIDVNGQSIELTQSSLHSCLEHPDREIRKKSYFQFYGEFSDHKNTIASLYTGSVHHDIYTARVRNYPSARAASLFDNNIPESVYDTLIEHIHEAFPVLHRYYAMRKKLLSVETLTHYDMYASLVPDLHVEYPFDTAVEIMLAACKPLGEEYCAIVQKGVEQRWIDRYESKGKRSGAFSHSAYRSYPYILMNYRNDSIDSLFTLLHEVGHSVHSYLSSKHNPYPQYQYTIFEAEIASTLNELLLSHYLEKTNTSPTMHQYLLHKKLDGFITTFFRQTMFAEFEHIVHKQAEQGQSLSLEFFTTAYQALLEQYFGSAVELPDCASLECLRIPHFYNAFYVYKYATGIASAVCFADDIIQSGDPSSFLAFLKRGGSMFPLDNLETSGVDVKRAVTAAIRTFQNTLEAVEAAM